MKDLDDVIGRFEEKQKEVTSKREQERLTKANAEKEFREGFEKSYASKLKPVLERFENYLKEKGFIVRLKVDKPGDQSIPRDPFISKIVLRVSTDKRASNSRVVEERFAGNSSSFEISPNVPSRLVHIKETIYPEMSKFLEDKVSLEQLDESQLEKRLKAFIRRIFSIENPQ